MAIEKTSILQNVDGQTGEILNQTVKRETIATKPAEDNYIKLYYDTWLAMRGDNTSPISDFLIVVGKYISYAEKGSILVLNKYQKEAIANDLDKSLKSVEKVIGQCIKKGIFMRVGRGTYMVSPYVLGKGSWDDIQNLRMKFDVIKQNVQLGYSEKSNPEEINYVDANGIKHVGTKKELEQKQITMDDFL